MNRPALLLVFLLGGWVGGTVFMWQTAVQNFAVAEQVALAQDEGFRATVEGLSGSTLRVALRHQASEVNRLFFSGWGWVQIPLAATALGLACWASAGRGLKALLGLMAVIVLGLALYVVPETVRLGRMLDFAPAAALQEARKMFWTLHHTYTALDMLKLVLALGAVGVVCRPARASRESC